MPTVVDQDLLATALVNPARLVLGPVSVTGAFPFGGTPIGVRRDADCNWVTEYQDIRDPLSGALLFKVRRQVERPIVRFLLEMPWDQNVLASAFNSTSVSAATSLPYKVPAETQIQGSVVPAAVVGLLGAGAGPTSLGVIADDPRLKSIYFLRVVPTIVADVTRFSPEKEKRCTIVVDFEPIPTADTTDPLYPYVGTKPWYVVGRWENMVL